MPAHGRPGRPDMAPGTRSRRGADERPKWRDRPTMSVTGGEPYGDDIYTEPDGDPDTLANLGPLGPMAGDLGGHRRGRRAPGGRGHRGELLRRALRTPAHRPPDQRAPALLRAPLPHPHREARRGRDVPRPGGVLAVGTGHRRGHPHPRHPPGPGAAGRRHAPSRTPPSSRSAPRSVPRSTASCPTPSSTRRSGPSATGCT